MAGAGVAGGAARTRWSLLSASVAGYAVLAVSSTLFLSPAYSAAGLYHPLLLATGFLAARGFDERALRTAATAMLLFASVLALWGAAEVGLGTAVRAHTLFETPATYAAVLNLCLLPVLATILATGARRLPAIVAVVLAVGVFAADSRGGLLALAAGIGFAIVLSMRGKVLRPRAAALILGLLVFAWAGAFALRSLPSTPAESVPGTEARAESSLSRLELYALSLKAWREQPVTGTGYLTFRYTLEQGRAEVPSYGVASETWFVHNDYLQALQELGLAGLLAMLGLAALPLLLAYRRLPGLPATQRPAAIGCASALAAMSVHALVDFPFYVPVCLLLYGALLGALDRQLIATPRAALPARVSSLGPRAVRAGALAIAAVILLRPVAAEAAAEWGLRKFADGDGQGAAFWLGAAQRIDARDWRYHWYAGQFWDAQAAQSGKAAAAQLAAKAYAAGFQANPLEINNLLGMISVHQRYRELLRAPADSATLKAWAARAAVLAPLHPQVARLLSP